MSTLSLFITGICYLLIVAFLFRFNYRAIRVTESHIIIINNLKPFRKIYRYTYEDLLGVGIGNAKGIRIAFYFKEKKSFSASMHHNIEQLCKFFIDKGIQVGSGDEGIRYFIAHYKNDPKANYLRRQRRKAKRKAFHLPHNR